MKRIVGARKASNKVPTGSRSRGKRISPALVLNAGPAGLASVSNATDEQWNEDIATLRKAAEDLVRQRQQRLIPRKLADDRFRHIVDLLEDRSAETRQTAVRQLYELDPDQAATLVNEALKNGSPEERRNIGTALADSGLLFEAIDDLMAENHERCYGAFSLLFLVAKAGVVQPLISVIERHPSLDLRLAVIRLLAASKEPQVASSLQRLLTNSALAFEIRTALQKAINQITGQLSATTSSAA